MDATGLKNPPRPRNPPPKNKQKRLHIFQPLPWNGKKDPKISQRRLLGRRGAVLGVPAAARGGGAAEEGAQGKGPGARKPEVFGVNTSAHLANGC